MSLGQFGMKLGILHIVEALACLAFENKTYLTRELYQKDGFKIPSF